MVADARPRRRGAYVLVLRLERAATVVAGRPGRMTFEAGTYLYVGSAMGGLEARIARHRRREKRLRWHIDYLLQHAALVDAIEVESTRRVECSLNGLIRAQFATSHPVPGFGSSDCACVSHLHRFDGDVAALRGAVAAWEPSR